MLASIRAGLRRRRRRAAVACVVVLLSAGVTTAHASPDDHHHVGEAVAVCLAVLATGVAAVASLPSLRRWVHGPPRAADAAEPAVPWFALAGAGARARGDPVLLLGVLRL